MAPGLGASRRGRALSAERGTVLIEGGTGQGAGSGRKPAWGREPLGICGTDPWVRKGLGPGGWRWGETDGKENIRSCGSARKGFHSFSPSFNLSHVFHLRPK